mmetsp:Transcript_10218/g.10289  ORF Transcript_10218/g.10289 Transcript_10218/m.10289 type:complete len:226 (-) Transcript_10218:30-707(-)|eukprot:CAMPEP_0182420728 /NCGR_PEP_ID=MMETSP1167-20130531/5755_1 /TAXON_ID=2988 /ORGANISM="Mallomonas Sp, Strain CCMP3275" /LENGTH=225 /DNA_ID=CAMNT_0024597087 /DNA_START=274 /DNA_END=951 /DNA_ORIENTATION=-
MKCIIWAITICHISNSYLLRELTEAEKQTTPSLITTESPTLSTESDVFVAPSIPDESETFVAPSVPDEIESFVSPSVPDESENFVAPSVPDEGDNFVAPSVPSDLAEPTPLPTLKDVSVPRKKESFKSLAPEKEIDGLNDIDTPNSYIFYTVAAVLIVCSTLVYFSRQYMTRSNEPLVRYRPVSTADEDDYSPRQGERERERDRESGKRGRGGTNIASVEMQKRG